MQLPNIYESDFPYLTSKPQGKKREKTKRNEVERLTAKRLQDEGILIKTLHDPNHVLGKRRAARLLSQSSDTMAPNVCYSLNKQNRWKTTEPCAILKNNEKLEVDVAVLERNFRGNTPFWFREHEDDVRALHTTDMDGNIVSKFAKGHGTNPKNLRIKHGEKKKRETKESDKSDESEVEVEEPEQPRVEYRIIKAHENKRVLTGQITGKSSLGAWKNEKYQRNKRVDMSDLEPIVPDMISSVEFDTEVSYKPSRDFKFCLGDFMARRTEKTEKLVYVRRQSVESIKMDKLDKEELPSDVVRPVDLLDISAVMRSNYVHEYVNLKTEEWKDFKFSKQVDDLSEVYSVRWLDADHMRAAVDVSSHLNINTPLSDSQAVVVLEKTKKNYIRVILNSCIPAWGPFNFRTLKNILVTRHAVDSVAKIVEVCIGLVTEWKHRMLKTEVNDGLALEHLPKANCQEILQQAELVSYDEQLALIRTATVFRTNSFERLGIEDFSEQSEDSDCDSFDRTSMSSINSEEQDEKPKVKCTSCSNSSMTDLFELECSWQCRDCLKAFIINRIRTKNIPLQVSFVVDENGSTYDILPAIIPLPLVNFYRKLACSALISLEFENLDVIDCPSCSEMLRIDNSTCPTSFVCSNCAFTWCNDCGNAPHWPLTCAENEEWKLKWAKQYSGDVLISSVIRKDFAEPILSAKTQRFDKQKANEISKKCRKNKTEETGKLSGLRTSVLYLVENGLAHLYMTKSTSQGLKSATLQLLRLLEEVEQHLEDTNKTALSANIISLEKSFHKLLDQYKTSLSV